MKVIVSFSGGKDSLASLLWVRNNLTKDFITVFCDTGWEHPLTYKYIEEVQEQLGLNLITVKSKKFNGMVDLTKKKSRWPSSQRRFCTSELKTIPMIDYILDEVNDDVLIIQGIRAAESAKRAEMSKQCTYFKYYVQPYGKDKNGKDKYHTYRRKDVLAFRKKYADDLLRPVFDWSAQQVIDYILENGIQPNPLYRMGYKRVGCFPCVMASQQDIYNISVQKPERISYIAGLEQQFNSSFFGPDKISSKYYKGEYPLISDVVRYVQSKRAGGSLKLICLPARGKRLFGADELDAELCIKDGMNYQIAEIHLGDVESSNILCEEIARRWNEHEEWHECKEDTEDVPPIGTYCILRVEYLCCSNKWKVDYLTAYYNKYGWTEDYLDQITCNYKDYKITHWKPINKPKGVEE